MPGRVRNILIAAIVASTLGSGCTDDIAVYGNIPPTTFQFVTVVDHDGLGPGGWHVAQVAVLLGRLSTLFPRAAVCDVEVGMPLASRQHVFISKEFAQARSAEAADLAARKLLGQRQQLSAPLCDAFRDEMRRIFATPDLGTVQGARVSSFNPWPGKNVPRRNFPPRRRR